MKAYIQSGYSSIGWERSTVSTMRRAMIEVQTASAPRTKSLARELPPRQCWRLVAVSGARTRKFNQISEAKYSVPRSKTDSEKEMPKPKLLTIHGWVEDVLVCQLYACVSWTSPESSLFFLIGSLKRWYRSLQSSIHSTCTCTCSESRKFSRLFAMISRNSGA